jgi:hypothetical protein
LLRARLSEGELPLRVEGSSQLPLLE